MTNSQKATVERIHKYVECNDLLADNYEIKTWEVEDTDYGVVIVYCVSGLKDDEGTLAAVFARTTRHIFVGKRGGVESYGKDNKTYKGWTNTMIFGHN